MKLRKNISISKRVFDMAESIMKARGFDDFSSLLEQLIREDDERRRGPHTIRETPPPYRVGGSERARKQ